MENIEIGLIRKKIFEYYEEENEVPSISMIVSLLEDEDVSYERHYLKKVLHKIGYRYLRCESPSQRHILVEKSGLVLKRFEYLKQIKECRAQNRNIYYMHESYMEAREINRRCDRYLKAQLPSKINDNERLVILFAGGRKGLVKDLFTTVKSDSDSGDHFAEVTPKFESWVTNHLKDKLQEKCVVAISSAAHLSIQKDKRPTTMWTSRTDMQEWLRRHNVKFPEDLDKMCLLRLIRKTRIEPVYVIDEILKELGYTVLRLPPYHPELNPLKHIWADIRKKIVGRHGNASLGEKRNIWDNLYFQYAAKWGKWDDLVENIENEYYDRIYKFDDIIEEIKTRYQNDVNPEMEQWTSDKTDSSSLSA